MTTHAWFRTGSSTAYDEWSCSICGVTKKVPALSPPPPVGGCKGSEHQCDRPTQRGEI